MSLYLSMAAFALAMSISPGPVNIVALSSGVHYGFRASLAHVSGATLGFTLLLLAVGLGLHQLLTQWPILQKILQYAGIAFLLWMAYKLARDSGQLSSATPSSRPSFNTGALMQWLNPKAWLASFAGMGAYVSDGSLTLTLHFALIYFVVCYASIASWAYIGSLLHQHLQAPSALRWFNRSMALLLLLSAFYLW